MRYTVEDGWIHMENGDSFPLKDGIPRRKHMNKRKKSGKFSRDKGKRFELSIANMLKTRGFNAKRGIQFRGGGEEQPDIICELLDFIHFELKAVERFNLNDAIKQAITDKKNGQIPAVVHKKNNETPTVSLPLLDFINILQWALNRLDNLNTLDLSKYRADKEKEGAL